MGVFIHQALPMNLLTQVMEWFHTRKGQLILITPYKLFSSIRAKNKKKNKLEAENQVWHAV